MEQSIFNSKFGEFVRNKRRTNNWSQTDLAAKMGNNFQNISRLERGKINPSFYWLFNLSKVFNQECSEFIAEFENELE